MTTDTRERSVLGRVVILVLILVGIAGANILAFTFGAGDTGDIANEAFGESNFFFPASYVFGTIWPTIYLFFAALMVHQLLPSQTANRRYAAGLPWLAASVFLNTGWIAIFDSQLFVWAFWAILPIVALAVVGHRRLGIGSSERATEAGTAEKVVTIGPRIYTAWVTVATIAAAASALLTVGWNGFGIPAETWGVVMIIVGAVLGVAFLFLLRDPVFPAVYAYAYVGIAVRWLDASRAVDVTSVVCAAILVAAFAVGLVVSLRR